MAVAVVLEFDDATLDQYDQVMEGMGLSSGDEMPNGGLFHWVMETGNGIRVTDVWETREQFEQFAQEQIGPQTQAAGITSEPQIQFHEVHNYLAR
jgi:hypothetical protein